MAFFKVGPFAWNGIMAFYIPLFVFFVWLAALTVWVTSAETAPARYAATAQTVGMISINAVDTAKQTHCPLTRAALTAGMRCVQAASAIPHGTRNTRPTIMAKQPSRIDIA